MPPHHFLDLPLPRLLLLHLFSFQEHHRLMRHNMSNISLTYITLCMFYRFTSSPFFVKSIPSFFLYFAVALLAFLNSKDLNHHDFPPSFHKILPFRWQCTDLYYFYLHSLLIFLFLYFPYLSTPKRPYSTTFLILPYSFLRFSPLFVDYIFVIRLCIYLRLSPFAIPFIFFFSLS